MDFISQPSILAAILIDPKIKPLAIILLANLVRPQRLYFYSSSLSVILLWPQCGNSSVVKKLPHFFHILLLASSRTIWILTEGISLKIRDFLKLVGCSGLVWRIKWRRGSESNRRRRLCRPLHDHSATPP